MRRIVIAAAAVLTIAVVERAAAEVIERSMDVAGTRVRYKLVLPHDYAAGNTYPGVLVFGGGPQTMRTIDAALENNFREQAQRRGYIVVAPAAPNDELFFRGGARIFPEFLDRILGDYDIEGRRFHVAGPSNGGIAAFHIAAQHPEYFVSVTAFPGYMWQPSDAKLQAISSLCVFAYIGENDRYSWHDEMRREIEYLDGLGTVARFSLEPDQPHRLQTLTGEHAGRLFDNFELARTGCRH
jgi:poly(3-hydroxybutyrate) depolymerase